MAHMKQLLVDRIGKPDDIVNAALYLASDESAFITEATSSSTADSGGRTATSSRS